MSLNEQKEDRNDSQGSMVTQCGSQPEDLSHRPGENESPSTSGVKSIARRKRRADPCEDQCESPEKCMSQKCHATSAETNDPKRIQAAIEKIIHQNQTLLTLLEKLTETYE